MTGNKRHQDKSTQGGRLVVWALGFASGLWVVLLVTVGGASATSVAARPQQEERETKAFQKVCNDCHEPDRIVETKRSRGGWEEILEKMIEKGATGSDQDFDLVLAYLLRHYGMVNMNQASPEDIALISGVSAKEADAIVAYRRANGNFKNFEGLTKVPSVDVKKLEEHKDIILF